MLAALSLYRCLAQEIPAFGKLTEKLVIQIVPVSDDHNGRTLHLFLQKMSIKHHRQGFSRTLSVPEYTAASVSISPGGSDRRGHRFADGKILMIASQNFECPGAFVAEADEVFQDIQKAILLEDSFKECVKLGIGRVFVAAVLRLPLHESVFARGNGPRLACRLVAHDADGVIDEHGRDLQQVIAQLEIGLTGIGFLPGGRLQLDDHHWQTVEEDDHIRTLVAVLNEGPLVRNDKGVVLLMFIVHQINQSGLMFRAVIVAYLNPVLKIIHENGVFLYQLAIFKVPKFIQCILDRGFRHSGIQPTDGILKLFIIEGACKIALDIRTIHMCIAHILKELYDGVFIIRLGIKTRHNNYLLNGDYSVEQQRKFRWLLLPPLVGLQCYYENETPVSISISNFVHSGFSQ